MCRGTIESSDSSLNSHFAQQFRRSLLRLRLNFHLQIPATRVNAEIFRREKDIGSVEPGKFADLIAVRGDVLRYISLLQRVDVVIKHGVRYK